jgi:hypothetical protein
MVREGREKKATSRRAGGDKWSSHISNLDYQGWASVWFVVDSCGVILACFSKTEPRPFLLYYSDGAAARTM